MIRIFLFLIFCPFVQLTAQTLRMQLLEVNNCWANYPAEANEPEQQFKDDRERIQAHLLHTIDFLKRKEFTVQETPEKRSQRTALLDELHAYAQAGVFPQNTKVPGRIPVFIDDAGTHCAVGYLMLKSGADQLAKKVAAVNNYIYIHQLTVPDFFAWQTRSGFSVDELALIQPSYYNPAIIDENQLVPPQCDSGFYSITFFQWNQWSQPQPQTQLKWKGSCDKNGKLNGRWVQFKRDGSIYVEGWFKNGLRDSVWRVYFDSKNKFLNEEAWWKDGKLHGPYLRYSGANLLAEKGMYEYGKKVGEWTTWMYNRKQTSANYVNGLKHGNAFAYYHNQQDTSTTIGTAEVFENGKLKTRKWYPYQSLTPSYQYEHIGDSLYSYKNFLNGTATQEEGYFYLFMVKERNFPYPDIDYGYVPYPAPPDSVDVERQVRTGKWIVRGTAVKSRIDNFPRDSAWLYLANDSITGAAIFNGKQQFSFECLPMSYTFPQYYSNSAELEIKFTSQARWTEGMLTSQVIYFPGTTKTKMYLNYRDGKLVSGTRIFNDKQGIAVQWTEHTSEPGVNMSITYTYLSGKIKCSGGALDTATRHGFWQFYDMQGYRYAFGRYDHNLKTGNWEETDTTTWLIERGAYLNGQRQGLWKEVNPTTNEIFSGQYVNGKRKGLWIRRNVKGEKLERKRY